MSIGYFQWTKIGCFRWTRSGCFRRTLTPSKYKCSSKDIFKQLNEGAVYVPLPERKPIAKVFISQAIEISENYQIDTEIRQGAGTVTVIFSFDCGGAMGFLKSVIQYADDISFFSSTNGYEIVLATRFLHLRIIPARKEDASLTILACALRRLFIIVQQSKNLKFILNFRTDELRLWSFRCIIKRGSL